MTIGSNISSFRGCPVKTYDPKVGLQDPANTAYKLGVDWESHENGARVSKQIEELAADPRAGELKNLVIGAWNLESGDPADEIRALTAASDKFTSLEGIFFGDITYEETEMSWIESGHLPPILYAYPKMKHFQARGGNSLSLMGLNHDQLEVLIIETGGLSRNRIPEIVNANLPSLQHLEVWLGSEDYGNDVTTDDLKPFQTLEKFPKLKRLGICNADNQDDVAILIANAPVLDRLEVLDLSKGNMSDKGAEALLKSERIRTLKSLELEHNYFSDATIAAFEKLHQESGVSIDTSDTQEADEYDDEEYRYIYVSE